MKTFLIGLSGYAGAGKDTVRNILENQHGFAGLAFADPIRSMLRELLTSSGIDDSYMDERSLKEAEIPELGVSYRQMAQTLGTEWGRHLVHDFWLRIAGAFLDDQVNAGETHFCISDVRFANEAAWIRERGGVIWRVQREAAVPVRAHVSESEIYLFPADYVIHNDGPLDALPAAVNAALSTLP